MVRAIDVANFFITEFRESDDPMTKVRLQKFLYFAQAETLVRLGRPLFKEDFKAWHYGPVVTCISNRVKDVPNGEPILNQLGEYDIHKFSLDEIEILIDVSLYCGKYSTAELSRISHVPGGPWDEVHEEKGKANTIPKDLIQSYYSKHDPIPQSTLDAIRKLPVDGYISAEGKTVLPRSGEWEF